MEKYFKLIDENVASSKWCTVLIGSKVDLADQRVVSEEEAKVHFIFYTKIMFLENCSKIKNYLF